MTVTVHLQAGYLKTIHCYIKLTQIILGIVACILFGSYCATSDGTTYCISIFNLELDSTIYSSIYKTQRYIIIYMAVVVVMNAVQFFLHLFNVDGKFDFTIVWDYRVALQAVILYVMFMGFEIYLIADLYDGYSRWIAATVLGFINAILFAVECILIRKGAVTF